MYMYVCNMYMYIYMPNVYAYLHMSIKIYCYIDLYAYICMYMYNTHIFMHTCTHIYIHIQYLHAHICMHVLFQDVNAIPSKKLEKSLEDCKVSHMQAFLDSGFEEHW